MSPRKSAFGAHADERTRVLICGSLPGERSLAERRYYAHPSNRFWQLAGAAIGRDLAAMDYDRRIEQLMAAGIGLWDVIKSAHRIGSLDAAIRDHQPNLLGAFAESLPNLRAIGFNGGKAAAIGRRQVRAERYALIDLPSSSAAYAAMPFAMKRERWLVLGALLAEDFPTSADTPPPL